MLRVGPSGRELHRVGLTVLGVLAVLLRALLTSSVPVYVRSYAQNFFQTRAADWPFLRNKPPAFFAEFAKVARLDIQPEGRELFKLGVCAIACEHSG